MVSKKDIFIKLVILFCLCFIFILTIKDNQFPDNENLVKRLYLLHHELNYTPQNLLVNIKTYIIYLINEFIEIGNKYNYKALNIKMSDYNRISFFIPTFFLILFIIIINCILKKIEKNNFFNRVNCSYIIGLTFPSVILGYTAISSESVYNIIALFIVANLSFKK